MFERGWNREWNMDRRRRMEGEGKEEQNARAQRMSPVVGLATACSGSNFEEFIARSRALHAEPSHRC